jgi:hypothetical protein
MANTTRKTSAPPGISAATLQETLDRLEAVERKLKEYFDEKNQWNSMLREWIGKPILVTLLLSPTSGDSSILGKLLWIDRYTICVEEEEDGSPSIIHKAAIAVIRPKTIQ